MNYIRVICGKYYYIFLLELRDWKTAKKILFNDREVQHKVPAVCTGPKLSIRTAWGIHTKTILSKLKIERVERYRIGETDFDFLTEKIHKNLKTFDNEESERNDIYFIDNISGYNNENKLGLDSEDIAYYSVLFSERKPRNIELLDLAQSNSEHSRHHFFKGKLIVDGEEIDETLFDMVKETSKSANERVNLSTSYLCDNASAIDGGNGGGGVFIINWRNMYQTTKKGIDSTFTAETHNFPTMLMPFEGAATGVGGRIRDTICIGKGGMAIAGTAGYCVKNICMAVEASDGASDYGNKVGEPIIGGFFRVSEKFVKPIMYSGGVGMVFKKDTVKNKPREGMYIVKIGGLAYRVGIGGGSASSKNNSSQDDVSSVQRSDPEMENKLLRVVRKCVMNDVNIIQSAHDQGAGGTANVTKEIIEDVGGVVNIDEILLGDPSMTYSEIWISEYQEQITCLVEEQDLEELKRIGKEENVSINWIGIVKNTGKLEVKNNEKDTILEFDLNRVSKFPQKNYDLTIGEPDKSESWELDIVNILSRPDVGSKQFLVNKVDRSVSGLVAQQQCVGPWHTPISNYSLVRDSYFSKTGCVVAIGENRVRNGNVKSMVHMVIGEMLTNIIGVVIKHGINGIRCSANWMWSEKNGELYLAMKELKDILIKLGIGIDGGKDSLSMQVNGEKSPNTLVLTGYARVSDTSCKVTPELKEIGNEIFLIDLGYGQWRFYPEMDNVAKIPEIFRVIQELIKDKTIISLHDRSDGGLITALVEMCISSLNGLYITFNSHFSPNKESKRFWTHEELGLVIECRSDKRTNLDKLMCLGVPVIKIGEVIKEDVIKSRNVLCKKQDFRQIWEFVSVEAELKQCKEECVKSEYFTDKMFYPTTDCSSLNLSIKNVRFSGNPKVAIIREEGCNGEMEMAAAFHAAGFTSVDVHMNLLKKKPEILRLFRVIAFVGGFSYADTFGGGYGWASGILHNDRVKKEFEYFYSREDTFSLGVCNGCQLMSLLNKKIPIGLPRSLTISKNVSGRFESRYSRVYIGNKEKCKDVFADMQNVTIGVWVSHEEGKMELADKDIMSIMIEYMPGTYPNNPNGSTKNVAGVVSDNGRHIAMMPHPERTFMKYQVPWDQHIEKYSEGFFWLKLFKNMYNCVSRDENGLN